MQSVVAPQVLLQIEFWVKVVGFEPVADAPNYALNHSIGFLGHGVGQPVFDARFTPQRFKFRLPT